MAGVNVYGYGNGNPVMYIDPDGRLIWIPVGAAIGAGMNVGFQLYRNGGNWGKIDIQEVGLAAGGGLLGGWLGTAAAGISNVGLNILVNTAGSGLISAGQKVAANVLHYESCWSTGVWDSATKGALFGFAGASVGNAGNYLSGVRYANKFNALPSEDKLFVWTNSIKGPYYPPGRIDWAAGGSVGGNVVSTLINNANQ